MEITEVRIKLMEEPGERLKAFCSITFDGCFVVRDLKIIEGTSGPFVAMPSRKLTSHCPRCRAKNHLRAQHCNQCGSLLPSDRMPQDNDGRAKLYADIAHPINSKCREMIQQHVIDEFNAEIQRAKQPDYVSRYDDFDVDYDDERSPSAAAKPDTRVDPAHASRASHTPRSGDGSSPPKSDGRGPVPTPKSASPPPSTSQPQASSEGEFGAGIFPES
ncbi:MAG: septation protein SpoVG family protein [Planctomycetota bacterium]